MTTAQDEKRPTNGKLAGQGATGRSQNLRHPSHDCKPELRYQPMISDRRVRGYLLERADYLEGRDEPGVTRIVDALHVVLAADEPGRLRA